ncbi:MAG TPA: carboxymuconolactone decarboxylase family protein [Chitinophagaceae bacterium]|jgi:AhpD family alkylhydroperoxidase|nr:carboxymuconolactone decarboxylase family protein [Chitinophagaceae bacterium]
MKKRIDFKVVYPCAYDTLEPIDKFVDNIPVAQSLKEFIRIRASQINGCALCVDAHSRDARKAGESEQRVFLVSAWREAGDMFTEEERTVFQMTEEITLIHQHGLSDAVYENAIRLFGEELTTQLIMAIISINAWNRIGVATQLRPAKRNQFTSSTVNA